MRYGAIALTDDEVAALDDGDDTVADGGKIRVPMLLVDGQPGSGGTTDAERNEANWWKRRADLETRWRDAKPLPRQREQPQRDRRPPPPPVPAVSDAAERAAASEEAYQRRCAKLEAAWRGGKP